MIEFLSNSFIKEARAALFEENGHRKEMEIQRLNEKISKIATVIEELEDGFEEHIAKRLQSEAKRQRNHYLDLIEQFATALLEKKIAKIDDVLKTMKEVAAKAREKKSYSGSEKILGPYSEKESSWKSLYVLKRNSPSQMCRSHDIL